MEPPPQGGCRTLDFTCFLRAERLKSQVQGLVRLRLSFQKKPANLPTQFYGFRLAAN